MEGEQGHVMLNNMVMHHNPILSICIPTWNRAALLSVSLERLFQQINGIDSQNLEIFVSDNASNDNTLQVVEEYIAKGMPITYNRNETNIGADRNFVCCMERANGKYIWLLGDDDFLKPNALQKIISILKEEDLGLLHLCSIVPEQDIINAVVCDDVVEYVTHVSYYSTFMSGNIFNRCALESIGTPDRYLKSFLVQMPFFIDAMLTHKINAYIGINSILDAGADGANNGGYNFFEVFVQNYLTIWKERLDAHNMPSELYEFMREHIFKNFTIDYTTMLLIRRKNVATSKVENGRKGWYTERGWRILFRFYGDKLYFYKMVGNKMRHVYVDYILRRLHLKK